jgi:hypothetical protein
MGELFNGDLLSLFFSLDIPSTLRGASHAVDRCPGPSGNSGNVGTSPCRGLWNPTSPIRSRISSRSNSANTLPPSLYRRPSGIFKKGRCFGLFSRGGGEGGIRTPDRLAPMPHFECGAFNHSATSPGAKSGPSPPWSGPCNRRGWLTRQGAGGKNCRNPSGGSECLDSCADSAEPARLAQGWEQGWGWLPYRAGLTGGAAGGAWPSRSKMGGTAIRANTLAVPCRLIAMPPNEAGVGPEA